MRNVGIRKRRSKGWQMGGEMRGSSRGRDLLGGIEGEKVLGNVGVSE